ncbi:MAG: DUF4258 domain-containing protein [Bacillota bacterium]
MNSNKVSRTKISNSAASLKRIRNQAKTENIRFTQHAHQEMVEEGITINEVLETIASGDIIEDYPEHRRGACCLLNGITNHSRPLHIVCTTTQASLIIITVYEPKLPKWITPTQRRRQE